MFWHDLRTAQLCVFDNRFASAWMQYATSARGLVAEIEAKTAAKNIHKANEKRECFFVRKIRKT